MMFFISWLFNLNNNKCIRRLMKLTKFLFILQKITVSIIVLTFIPIALFIYSVRPVTISDGLEGAYQTIKHQVQLSGFLTGLKQIQGCQPPASLLFYQNCYNRCTIGADCNILGSTQICFLGQKFYVNSYQFCSQSNVFNQINTINSTLVLNASFTPLAHVRALSSTQLSYQYYCVLKNPSCIDQINRFGKSIIFNYKNNYDKFWQTSTYLMYFGLIPLIAHILTVMIIDLSKKINLRLTNSLLIVHEALIGIGIIVNGILFNQKNDDFNKSLQQISNACIIKDGSYCQKTFYSIFTNFNSSDGVSSSFTIAMAFVLVLQVLCIIVIVIINILIIKYYKLRDINPSSDGYELQEL